MVSGRWPLVEDDFSWKTTFSGKATFGGRQPSMEDDLLWKTTFGGRQPLMEDNLLRKTTFGERQPWWKTTFSGRQPSVEEDLCWQMTFGERLSVVEDDLQWKTTFIGSLHAAYSTLRHSFFQNWRLFTTKGFQNLRSFKNQGCPKVQKSNGFIKLWGLKNVGLFFLHQYEKIWFYLANEKW